MRKYSFPLFVSSFLHFSLWETAFNKGVFSSHPSAASRPPRPRPSLRAPSKLLLLLSSGAAAPHLAGHLMEPPAVAPDAAKLLLLKRLLLLEVHLLRRGQAGLTTAHRRVVPDDWGPLQPVAAAAGAPRGLGGCLSASVGASSSALLLLLASDRRGGRGASDGSDGVADDYRFGRRRRRRRRGCRRRGGHRGG